MIKTNKKNILINLLVICLYFLWPYFSNSFISILKFNELTELYISFAINFIFLFIILYIYRNKLKKYFNEFKKNYKKEIFKYFKIFLIGLIVMVAVNNILYLLHFSAPNNTKSMINIFSKIPFLFVLNTLFYYPVIEEIVFKMTIKDIISKKWLFIILTGIFNGFFQIVFSMQEFSDLIYILPISIFFISLSYIYYETDNIIYPILYRIFYNVIPCVLGFNIIILI